MKRIQFRPFLVPLLLLLGFCAGLSIRDAETHPCAGDRYEPQCRYITVSDASGRSETVWVCD